jgi:hypothetical protein
LSIDAAKSLQKKQRTKETLSRAKKALEKNIQTPTPIQAPQHKTNLMCIDIQALTDLNLPKLVETFEEIKEHAPIQDFTFLQTKEHKYLYASIPL